MSITSVVDLTVGKIGEILVKEAKFLCGVEDKVRSFQKEFKMMKSFLKDMEFMGVVEGGDERSRTTIKEIRKIAFDAEDVIESYILEVSSSTDKKKNFYRRYLCFCSSVWRTHQVGCEIESITGRISETMEILNKFMGGKGIMGIDDRQGSNKTQVRTRPSTYPHTREDHVVGLDEDINKLVRVLTNREHTQTRIVTIVGMGGSGKTTLARKLYNHESVKKQFNCVAWVSVSQQWNVQQIILELLKKVTGETMAASDSSFNHHELVGKLHEYLEMKSYLIVLDDVWESKALQDIRPALPIEGDGGKIIITTRNKKIVNYSDLKPITYSHTPKRLNEQESWELFKKIALVHGDEINNSMKELGRMMLKKCGGLPLAVIALAGILFDKENMKEWEKVSKAVSSRIMEEGNGTQLYGPVNQMLVLSYLDLPSQLKPCFLYLARYREDHEILVGKLIRLWIAEGFITSTQLHEGGTIEDMARQYLDELVHRCFVIVLERNFEGKVKLIQIHDLVRDLCIRKARDEDFLETAPNSKNIESRRGVLLPQVGNLLQFPTNSQHLRSLICQVDCEFDTIDFLDLPPIHQNWRLLKILILDRVMIRDGILPVWIGNLIHLRYLGLRSTNIKELPSSIGNLRNLLTLDCSHIVEVVLRVPDVLWKLERLMHIFLHCEVDVRTLKLHTLKSLQTLKMADVDNWMLEELPRLSPTIQKLTIGGIRSQELLDATFKCQSIRSEHLYSLCLAWKDGITLGSLDPIIHCQHLRKLHLAGRVRDGVGIQFPANIYKLTLWNTEFEAEATLIALGKLPHLNTMVFQGDVYMGNQWTCKAGAFVQLKVLNLDWFTNLEEWSIEKGAMPLLTTLRIEYCMQLKKLPNGLELITALQYLRVSGMGHGFMERIKKGGEDFHIIQRIPSFTSF